MTMKDKLFYLKPGSFISGDYLEMGRQYIVIALTKIYLEDLCFPEPKILEIEYFPFRKFGSKLNLCPREVSRVGGLGMTIDMINRMSRAEESNRLFEINSGRTNVMSCAFKRRLIKS